MLVSFGILFLYSGAFNIAADVPHSKPTYWLMETARNPSIAVGTRAIQTPALDDPAQIIAGAADYAEMCSGCHLQPGVEKSEVTVGLNVTNATPSGTGEPVDSTNSPDRRLECLIATST